MPRVAMLGEEKIPRLVLRFASTTLAALLLNSVYNLTDALFNNVIRNVGGTFGINTFAYINKILSLALVPFAAVTQALAPIMGFNSVAGNI